MAPLIRALAASILTIGYFAALGCLGATVGVHLTPAATLLFGIATILALLFIARQLLPEQRKSLTIGALVLRALDHIVGARS